MNKNSIIVTVLVAVVVAGVAFFAGMTFQKSKQGVNMMAQGQFRNGAGRTVAFQGRGGGQQLQGMTPVAGEIISKDENSLTVKLPDGSSKIVIVSDSSKINKTSEGSVDDLKTGESITVFGKSNSDGSVTAQNISLGNMMFRMGERPVTSVTPAK